MTDTAPPAAPDPRPDTSTRRPGPLPPDPTIEQLRQERADLHAANNGQFTLEEHSRLPPVPPPPPTYNQADRTFTVLVMMVFLNTVKLCLIMWILLTVIQVREQNTEAASQRSTLAITLATLQKQLDAGVAQQQVLINRVDDTLVRLPQSPTR